MFDDLVALVVDESHTVQRITSGILKDQLNFKQVIQTESPGEALRMIGAGLHVDLILSAWDLAGLTGLEFLRRVRENPSTADVAFFLMTTHEDDETLLKAFKGGVNDYLIKPFSPQALIRKINRACRAAERRRSSRFNVKPGALVEMRFKDQLMFTGDLLDISQGGCLLRTAPFRKGAVTIYDHAALSIQAPNGAIQLSGETLRMENDHAATHRGKYMRVAFQFVDVHGVEMTKLLAYLESLKPTLPDKIG